MALLRKCHTAPTTKNENITVAIVGRDLVDFQGVWLLNKSTVQIKLDAGELFGFNVGSYKDKTLGQWCCQTKGCS